MRFIIVYSSIRFELLLVTNPPETTRNHSAPHSQPRLRCTCVARSAWTLRGRESSPAMCAHGLGRRVSKRAAIGAIESRRRTELLEEQLACIRQEDLRDLGLVPAATTLEGALVEVGDWQPEGEPGAIRATAGWLIARSSSSAAGELLAMRPQMSHTCTRNASVAETSRELVQVRGGGEGEKGRGERGLEGKRS